MNYPLFFLFTSSWCPGGALPRLLHPQHQVRRLGPCPRPSYPLLLYGIVTLAHAGGIEQSYGVDRKSTRLNSSHVSISYAVFCLKKKKGHLHSKDQAFITPYEAAEWDRPVADR